MYKKNELCELENIKPVDTDKYRKTEELLGVLSNKTRLAILSIILEHKSVCACELQPALGLEQPTVTTHLQKLYTAGVLQKRNEWRYTFYSIKEEYVDFLNGIVKQLSKISSSSDKNSISSR